jgi:hypothetical protein
MELTVTHRVEFVSTFTARARFDLRPLYARPRDALAWRLLRSVAVAVVFALYDLSTSRRTKLFRRIVVPTGELFTAIGPPAINESHFSTGRHVGARL